ncbi:MAG: amino acid permease [Deltaproteobacteria bacterium]|jgi:D-serine/D-alanine/glycine transporter|nr:amino acid permease [Deltaproteobacteria bacterium]
MSTKQSIDAPEKQEKLKRGLSNRHIQLIAIGGAIGTGLFMGSGKTISMAGPSIVFVYLIIGFFMYLVMRAMGELLLSNLSYKSFTDFCEDILGPKAGFFIGWSYWFVWVVAGTADVIAISSYVYFWFPDISAWIPAISCVLLLVGLNLVSVNLFGEMEFWFALLKVIAIVAIIVIGAILVLTSFVSPDGHVASLANIWENGGLFPKGALGFFAGFQMAIFAFGGIELIGAAAAEAKNPETNLPRAINTIPLRIILFYAFALLAIMAITPWNSLDPGASPFVTTFAMVGIPAAAGIINFVAMTSAASSANSGIYSTSRMVYGLAKVGAAPKFFGKLSQNRVPTNALLFSCICVLLGTSMLIIMPSIMAAFTVMTTIAAILLMFVWTMTLFSYLSYRRKYPERHQASKFKLPGGTTTCYITLLFFVFVIVLLALEEDTRMVLMLMPVWFGLLYVCQRLSSKHHRKFDFDAARYTDSSHDH